MRIRRRAFVFAFLFFLGFVSVVPVAMARADAAAGVTVATFDVDATPPVGASMAYDPVKRGGELSLRCRGIVLLGAGQPIVLCAVDWIGIGNEGHDVFREALAQAAGTTPQFVAVHTLHQHDASSCDFTAERILHELGVSKLGRFEGAFHRQVIQRAAKALRASLSSAQPVTHYGWGVAEVEKVASNRRIMGPDGRVRAVRWTTTTDPALRAEPEGVIDPQLSMLSFWNGEKPVAVLSYYACHPQSYYRTGIPSPDFPGIARFIRGQSVPEALHVHFNGAGGNIGAGKYNDGAKANRMKLALRVAEGMRQAWTATEKFPLAAADIGWQTVPVQLPVAAHLNKQELIKALKAETPRGEYIAGADKLAWLTRCEAGHAIDIGCLRVGKARVLHMPGELFVEYQLAAKAMRPDLQVAMAAYGDYGPAYIGTTAAYAEGGYETSERASFVAPEVEPVLTRAVKQLLQEESPSLRVKPLEPDAATSSFEVLDGFEMQLVASEPDVIEPIVLAYDENGQMYVAEYLKFPAKGGKSDGPDGRIRLLRDDDGDGRYEQSHVFAEGLAWPTGICPWDGGVYVIAAPDLWYLKDTDGDGKADVRKKMFTGFGFITEEGSANNLIWGLDHWIYGAGSNSGGEVRPADDPNARAVSLRGRDFRFHPATGQFEAISGSEQFGNTFDDWGNRFICQNSKPVVHVILPAHYLSRNPYLPVPAVRRNIWSGGDRVYRASAPEPWRLARSKIRLSQDRKWAASYVAHDVFTACTGVTIYRGAAYPEKYRGNLFVGEVQSNLIHRRTLRSTGGSFESLRADEGTEMVRSKDNWFRPANMANAPDGTLHIVDMYREVIETPDSLPEEIIARIDLHSGHNRGRIYRLAPPGFKLPAPPQLGAASTEQLVRELENANGWWRDTASRLLFERQDRAAIAPLKTMLRETASELAQLHTLYALEGLAALNDEDLALGLASASPGVREHAVRLAEPRLQASEPLLKQVVALADDANPRVRFQVAFSLGETDDRRAAEALANIARRDAGDVWIRTAVLSSSLKLSAGMLEGLLADSGFASSSGGQQFLRQLALVVGGRNRKPEVVSVLKLIESSPGAKPATVRQAVLLGLGDGLRRSRSSLSQYVSESPTAAKMLSGLIDAARQTLANVSSTAKQRQKAIEMLAHGRFDDVSDLLVDMLDSREAPAVQLAAVQTLSTFASADVPPALIDAWQGLSPSVRGEVVEALLGRHDWVNALLDAIKDGEISPAYIAPVRKVRLVRHPDATIRSRAEKLFGTDGPSPRKSVVDGYRSALSLSGDAQRGQKVFEQNCMTCHKVGGKGHDVGPNLATIQNRTPEALMIQILDPNREVLANYTQYVIVLDSGRVVTGLIASESPTSITLKRAEDVQETVLRQNIDEIIGSGKSLMPEGLEQKINQQQLSDLLAFLLDLRK